MKQFIILGSIFISSFLGALHCVARDQVRKEELLSIDKVMLSLPAEVLWNASKDVYSCELIGKKEVLDSIDLDYHEELGLAITWKGNAELKKKDSPKIVLTLPKLQQIYVDTPHKVEFDDLKVSTLQIINNGFGKLKFQKIKGDTLNVYSLKDGLIEFDEIDSKYMQVLNRANGEIVMSGLAYSLNLINQGKGVINGAEMLGVYVNAIIQGMGSIFCHVNEVLNGKIEAGGDIIYTGHPTIHKEINGSGRIMFTREDYTY